MTTASKPATNSSMSKVKESVMSEVAKCELCGEPMPPGEEMFNFHGYSGPCPKPPLPKKRPAWIDAAAKECAERVLVGEGERAFAEIIERHAAQGSKPQS